MLENSLVPKRKATTVNLSAYSSDHERFKKFINLLNEDLDEEGEYTEEDVFSFMLMKGLESYPKYKDRLLGISRRGRKPKDSSDKETIS